MKFWYKALIVLSAVLVSELITSDTVTFAIAGSLVLILGIPHGASDPIVYNFLKNSKFQIEASYSFLLVYTGLIATYLLAWILFPRFSLMLFLMISAYHFGETQFIKLQSSEILNFLVRSSWGILILMMMLLPHLEVLADWLSPILGSDTYLLWLGGNFKILLISTAVMFLTFLAIADYKLIQKEVLELIVLFFLFNNTSVLIGFSIFFCFWHSRDAIVFQLKGFKKVDYKLDFISFMKKLVPYSLMSIVGLIVLTILSLIIKIEISWVIVFFILVALLTLPHSILINRFYNKVT